MLARCLQPFSTLYRVDAIEAETLKLLANGLEELSVPSIGSMLLKQGAGRGESEAGRLSVPSIGSMLLKPGWLTRCANSRPAFQYPLSGRCY